MEQTKSIKISKSSEQLNSEHYLNETNINPFKSSPPNSWNTRLKGRYFFHFKKQDNPEYNSNKISIEKFKI
jgi:hypothetical protein